VVGGEVADPGVHAFVVGDAVGDFTADDHARALRRVADRRRV
jgi:isochorismate hydrolase